MPDIDQIVPAVVDTEEELTRKIESLQRRLAITREIYRKLAEVTEQLEAEFAELCEKLAQFAEETYQELNEDQH